MEKTIESIANYLIENQIVNENAELHARRIYALYAELGRENLLDEDLELEDTLDLNLDCDDLTLYSGLGYYAKGQYSPDDEWWWFMEMDGTAAHVCKAISVRTGEILDEDELALEFSPEMVPSFHIDIASDNNDMRHGEVSCPIDPERPWMTSMLARTRATGSTDDEVIGKIITKIQTAFVERYHRPLCISPENYEVKSW